MVDSDIFSVEADVTNKLIVHYIEYQSNGFELFLIACVHSPKKVSIV